LLGIAEVEFLGGQRFPDSTTMLPQTASINTQQSGNWTIYSAQEWLQNGETVTISSTVGDPDGNLWFGTIGVVISMGGGPSAIYGSDAMEAFDQFKAAGAH
jgi:hypothetical protein